LIEINLIELFRVLKQWQRRKRKHIRMLSSNPMFYLEDQALIGLSIQVLPGDMQEQNIRKPIG